MVMGSLASHIGARSNKPVAPHPRRAAEPSACDSSITFRMTEIGWLAADQPLMGGAPNTVVKSNCRAKWFRVRTAAER